MLVSCTPNEPKELQLNAILPGLVPSAPLAHWTATPTRLPISVERSGASLRGWTFLAPAGNSKAPTVLFFNGNAMDIDDYQSLYRQIAVQGANLTVFDYRGYGFSTGRPDVMAFRQDALTLYDKLAASGPVVVYGFSMGTAMACLVPSQEAVAGLDNANLIRQSQAPLPMLHGEDDQLVPIGQGREVFAASPSHRKAFVSLPATAHNETVEALRSMQAVRSFLGELAH